MRFMRMQGYILSLVCIFLMSLTSCKPTVPKEYIQPDEMEDILYDYHISQAMAYQEKGTDNLAYTKSLYYHAVLRRHGVTEAEFDSSLVYYYAHAETLQKIYKNISARMEKEALALGASAGEIGKYSQLKADGDTANIWRDATSVVLMPVAPYNRIDFEVKSDSTFMRGDSFMLNFMASYVYQSGTKDAVAYIAVHYANDSISTHSTHISTSGVSQLRVAANMESAIKGIDGFIYLNRGNDESNTLKLMFVDNIQLIRFHPDKKLIDRNDSIRAQRSDSTAINRQQPDSMTRDSIRRLPITGGKLMMGSKKPMRR